MREQVPAVQEWPALSRKSTWDTLQTRRVCMCVCSCSHHYKGVTHDHNITSVPHQTASMRCAQLPWALKNKFPITFCPCLGILNILIVKARSTEGSRSIWSRNQSPTCPEPEEDAGAKTICSSSSRLLPYPPLVTFQLTPPYQATSHDGAETRLCLKEVSKEDFS